VPIYLDYSARTDSIRSISLQAKVAGYIQQQHVPDGSDVKEGDLLYTIDPREYQAALDQAKAQVQRDEAALTYARNNFDRGTSLAKSGFLAKDTFDQRNSAVAQGEAALAMSQAAVKTAELNLGYTEIRAPFNGRLGRNQASIGTLITVGGAPLNSLVQLNPIYVSFNPSETDLVEIQKARASGKVRAEVLLPGETAGSHFGELTFVDNAVDQTTGTIRLKATFPNTEHRLWPGQFVNVTLTLTTQQDAIVVPAATVQTGQEGSYVFVIDHDKKAQMRPVSTGRAVGDLTVVTSGITAGERVVVDGQSRLSPGAAVDIKGPAEQTANK